MDLTVLAERIVWTERVGLVVLAVLGGMGLYLLANKADPTITGALLTALAALGGVLLQKELERRFKVLEELRSRRASVYNGLLSALADALMYVDGPPDKAAIKSILPFRTQVVVWGSSDVTAALARCHYADGDGKSIGSAYEYLIRAIRKDLGHDDDGLADGTLLRVLLADLPHPASDSDGAFDDRVP